MNKLDFKKIIRYFKPRWHAGGSPRVLRDWKLLFCVYIVLLVLICAVDGYVWWQYDSAFNGEPAMKQGIPIGVKTDLMKRVLDEADRRGKRFEQFQDPKTPIDIKYPAFPEAPKSAPGKKK